MDEATIKKLIEKVEELEIRLRRMEGLLWNSIQYVPDPHDFTVNQ